MSRIRLTMDDILNIRREEHRERRMLFQYCLAMNMHDDFGLDLEKVAADLNWSEGWIRDVVEHHPDFVISDVLGYPTLFRSDF